eukprot:m.337338 g.337338  ORF g.337338 m.337338 type:complete len:310 (+) comp18103_c0_seq1:145-1074(+)
MSRPSQTSLPEHLRPHGDQDFEEFRKLCSTSESEEFQKIHDKKGIQVFVKAITGTSVKMIKTVTTLSFPKEIVTDVLMDEEFRPEWDTLMLEAKSVYKVSDTCTIDYYSSKTPGPLKNRDIVTLRTWRETDDELLCVNKSVEIPTLTPTKKFIRMISYTTGHRLETIDTESCHYTYVSHFDPKGDIPKILVNGALTTVAPKNIKSLIKSCELYPEWKANHKPEYKPWRTPSQMADLPNLPEECLEVVVEEATEDNSGEEEKLDEGAIEEMQHLFEESQQAQELQEEEEEAARAALAAMKSMQAKRVTTL